jgi:EAL domain-containing protein (putative c-di-GMP-specific phosphodiesterase class I)
VVRLITSAGVKPGTLKLELTESVVSSGDGIEAVLCRLRGCGVSIAIDDFGTGLSTLSQLQNVPFDTVKIDKSFLPRETPGNAEGGVVLRSIVRLTHELGRVVVLEGVETERDIQLLREIGCEYAQGFYFGDSLARVDVPVFVASHRPAANMGSAEFLSGVSGVSGEA